MLISCYCRESSCNVWLVKTNFVSDFCELSVLFYDMVLSALFFIVAKNVILYSTSSLAWPSDYRNVGKDYLLTTKQKQTNFESIFWLETSSIWCIVLNVGQGYLAQMLHNYSLSMKNRISLKTIFTIRLEKCNPFLILKCRNTTE